MVRNQLPSSEQRFNGLSARGSGNVHDAPQDRNVRAARYVPTSAVVKPRDGLPVLRSPNSILTNGAEFSFGNRRIVLRFVLQTEPHTLEAKTDGTPKP